MKAIFRIAVCCGFAVFSTTACDSGPYHVDGLKLVTDTKTNCENSGGTFVDALCVCGQTSCPLGVTCKEDNKNKCAETEFEALCKASGGTYKEGKCECRGTKCDDGVVCNKNTKECPESPPLGFCKPNDVFCSNSQMYECKQDNTWVKANICEKGCRHDKTKCAECTDEGCKEGKLYKCSSGVILYTGVKCKSNKCTDDGTKCEDFCKDGEKSCFDLKVQECKNNSWIPEKVCNAGCADDGKSCAKNCDENSTLCTNGLLKTCKGNNYNKGTACPNGASCKSETECGECKDETTECEKGDIKTCNKGVWSNPDACENDFSCKSETECGECINHNIVCKNDETTQFGHLETCVDGTLVKGDDCRYEVINYSCKGGSSPMSECGECINGDVKCEQNKEDLRYYKHVCKDGSWGRTRRCNAGCNADLTDCS